MIVNSRMDSVNSIEDLDDCDSRIQYANPLEETFEESMLRRRNSYYFQKQMNLKRKMVEAHNDSLKLQHRK